MTMSRRWACTRIHPVTRDTPEGGGTGVTTSSYTMTASDTPTYQSGDYIKAVVTATNSSGVSTNADAPVVW